jgi:hypothetical protein
MMRRYTVVMGSVLVLAFGLMSCATPCAPTTARRCTICRFVDSRGQLSFAPCDVPEWTAWPEWQAVGPCDYRWVGPRAP